MRGQCDRRSCAAGRVDRLALYLERTRFVIRSLLSLLPLAGLALAATPLAAGGDDKTEEKPKDDAPPKAPEPPEEPPVVTRHEVKIGEKTLRYDVTTGMMPIKNE